MVDDNAHRRGRHCIFALHVHLVFVTKYRRRVFTAAILDDAERIFASVCADQRPSKSGCIGVKPPAPGSLSVRFGIGLTPGKKQRSRESQDGVFLWLVVR